VSLKDSERRRRLHADCRDFFVVCDANKMGSTKLPRLMSPYFLLHGGFLAGRLLRADILF